MCYRRKKYTVCWRVRASFSAGILQAGAVKGLKCFAYLVNHATDMYPVPLSRAVDGFWLLVLFVYFVHLAQVSWNTADTTVQREAQTSPASRECSEFLEQQRHTCATRRWTISSMDHCDKYGLGPATDVTPVICMSHKCHTSTWPLCEAFFLSFFLFFRRWGRWDVIDFPW